MDSLHAIDSAHGSRVDGQRRCALHLAHDGHPRLPPHGRSGALLALYFRVWVCPNRRLLRGGTPHQRPVAAAGAHLALRVRAGVEHLRLLRQLPLPA